jgi:N-methylhydantoinase B/oxoprolinase/acetone carboxylase alpha subunit
VGHGAGFLHCSDIGGLVPASISPRAVENFQEGLRVPPKKLFVNGAVNRDLLDVIPPPALVGAAPPDETSATRVRKE